MMSFQGETDLVFELSLISSLEKITLLSNRIFLKQSDKVLRKGECKKAT